MKKYMLIAGLPLMFACNSGKKEISSLEDSLSKVKLEMHNELHEKDVTINNKEAAINDFIDAFNEISENLATIRVKEKMISAQTAAVELKKPMREQILTDIQQIYDLLNKNKMKVAGLNKKINEANLKNENLNIAITNLGNQLNEKETDIAAVRSQLEKLRIDLSSLQIRYEDATETADKKTNELNTAYYTTGSAKELLEKGVTTREGGFIGIGKITELNKNMNPDYLTQIDIRTMKALELDAKKAKLITTHPSDSYEFKKEDGRITRLVIRDPEKFWAASKYLVVSTEK